MNLTHKSFGVNAVPEPQTTSTPDSEGLRAHGSLPIQSTWAFTESVLSSPLMCSEECILVMLGPGSVEHFWASLDRTGERLSVEGGQGFSA